MRCRSTRAALFLSLSLGTLSTSLQTNFRQTNYGAFGEVALPQQPSTPKALVELVAPLKVQKIAALVAAPVSAGAPQLRVRASRRILSPEPGAQLAFSENGQLLRVIGNRVTTYDATTGTVVGNSVLDAGAQIFSVAANGQTVLYAVPVQAPAARLRLRLFDAGTGQAQDLPADWYDSEYNGLIGAISANGRLISIYAEGGPADQPMVVTVYDWLAKRRMARQSSEYISAGGGFGGGVTSDGVVEFVNNRAGRKLFDLETGRFIGSFGYLSVRSEDGAWVVEFPNRNWNESAPKDVLVKDGATAAVRGNLAAEIADNEAYGAVTGAFCGTTSRFVMARRGSVAVYSIPSGSLLVELPQASWRDTTASDDERTRVACSPTGTRVGILSGARLTIDDLQ